MAKKAIIKRLIGFVFQLLAHKFNPSQQQQQRPRKNRKQRNESE